MALDHFASGLDEVADPAVAFPKKSHSSRFSPAQSFLYRSGVPFEWVELTTDEQARELAQVSDLQGGRLPVCFFPDGTRQECPTIRQIAEKLGWFLRPPAQNTISPFWRQSTPAT